ncbi:MAG: transposase [Planctomycetes bacterium]|nr:transposase [Planctomycetota bacterium]
MRVRAYHSIISAYGFWLPNDPRGSWSDWIRSWELFLQGRATKVSTTRSVAGKPHNRQKRLAAKQSLLSPPVVFDGTQAQSVALGFKEAVEESGYVVHACAILPEHVYLVVVRTSNRDIERIVGHLKGRATQHLMKNGLHPLRDFRDRNDEVPSPWAQKGWNVYLFTTEEIRSAIRYVEDNPLKEGKRRQAWSLVTPFE